MTSGRAGRRPRHRVFAALAASSRREVLRFLLVQDSPVTERKLAAHLAAIGQPPEPWEPSADRHPIHTALIHRHLPTLEDADLISWDRDAATVNTASHPAFDDPRFRLLLEAEADDLDAALSNLAIERRRILLTVLRDTQMSITQGDLTRELLRSNETDLEPGSDTVDDVLVSLSHNHLPALDDAGLIEYDWETGRAAYTGHPAVEEVFTIIYEPDKRLVESYDGFFEGLEAAYNKLIQETDTKVGWPHAWREDPSHG